MALWYYHCRYCNHRFKLGKAVKFSLDKVKTPIFCPSCGSKKTEESTKAAFDRSRRHVRKNPL